MQDVSEIAREFLDAVKDGEDGQDQAHMLHGMLFARQALALERCAVALETLVERLDGGEPCSG